MHSKRASLELSIRTIVIVILAMTLLGLGLGYIRGMFSDITKIREDVTEQVRQQIIDDLIINDKKLSFPKTEVDIEKGGSEILIAGIRNKEDETLNYKMVFTPQSGPADVNISTIADWFQYGQDVQQLAAADSAVRSIRLSVPNDAKRGSYFLTFDIKDTKGTLNISDDGIYAQKDFFIVVKS